MTGIASVLKQREKPGATSIGSGVAPEKVHTAGRPGAGVNSFGRDRAAMSAAVNSCPRKHAPFPPPPGPGGCRSRRHLRRPLDMNPSKVKFECKIPVVHLSLSLY